MSEQKRDDAEHALIRAHNSLLRKQFIHRQKDTEDFNLLSKHVNDTKKLFAQLGYIFIADVSYCGILPNLEIISHVRARSDVYNKTVILLCLIYQKECAIGNCDTDGLVECSLVSLSECIEEMGMQGMVKTHTALRSVLNEIQTNSLIVKTRKDEKDAYTGNEDYSFSITKAIEKVVSQKTLEAFNAHYAAQRESESTPE